MSYGCRELGRARHAVKVAPILEAKGNRAIIFAIQRGAHSLGE